MSGLTGISRPTSTPGGLPRGQPGLLDLAGGRYWTASLLPALVGTTLPLWLRPPGFSFRWLGALEFLIGAGLIHAGFAFLHARVRNLSTADWPGYRLVRMAAACIGAGCLIGLHLNSNLSLHSGVPKAIFIVYGLATLIIGALYVAPPFNFWRRAGGEVVLCEGLALVPVLGAFLVQVGDITRNVYLASLPLAIATALWVWTDELSTRAADERDGRGTMVLLFSPLFTRRIATLALTLGFFATLLAAVLSSSLSPWALLAAFSFPLLREILLLSWVDCDNPNRMIEARSKAVLLQLATGIIVATSSLVPLRI